MFSSIVLAADVKSRLIVADFNSGQKPNNLGLDWGVWNFNPNDAEQGCLDAIEADDFEGKDAGYSIRLDYDVQSRKPAFNGFWMKLGSLDVRPYEWFSFFVRGRAEGKFTKRFKVELKNKQGQRAAYLAEVLSSEWQSIRIPFKKNSAVTDWSQLTEFVIVFDDILATHKEGTIYIDQVEFQK